MNNELQHYGILGMKWGVRRDKDGLGVSRKTRREAEKDAKEFARAKMYYGKGAGTRRKLIRESVKFKSKDPAYKKAFDDAYSKQDMSRHAEKARSERKVTDVKETSAKTARGVVHIVTGSGAQVSAAVAAGYGAYRLAKQTGADKVVASAAKKTMASASSFLKDQGVIDFIKRHTGR